MEQRSMIPLQLIGVLLFGIALFLVNGFAADLGKHGTQTYNFALVQLLKIPLHAMIMVGTVLLRLDLIVRFLHVKPRFHWSALVVFGWPFVLFVVAVPAAIYVFPQFDILMWIDYYFHRLLGTHAPVLASMVCGFGVIWALAGETKVAKP